MMFKYIEYVGDVLNVKELHSDINDMANRLIRTMDYIASNSCELIKFETVLEFEENLMYWVTITYIDHTGDETKVYAFVSYADKKTIDAINDFEGKIAYN